MKNLDKLWELWSSGDQKLTIELIKGQGLDIRSVLLDFWNNRLQYGKEEGGDIYYKNTRLCQSGIGITSVPDDFKNVRLRVPVATLLSCATIVNTPILPIHYWSGWDGRIGRPVPGQ